MTSTDSCPLSVALSVLKAQVRYDSEAATFRSSDVRFSPFTRKTTCTGRSSEPWFLKAKCAYTRLPGVASCS